MFRWEVEAHGYGEPVTAARLFQGSVEMARISRRRLLGYGAVAGTALTMPWLRPGTASAESTVAGKLTKYREPLPVPGAGIVVATPTAGNRYAFTQRAITRTLHPDLPPTPLWAYDDGSGLGGQAGSFGMALVAQVGTPVTATFTHALPATYPAWIPVDTRLTPLGDQVRLMTHLHGGFVTADSDGNPAVTPRGFGPGQTQTVVYPNDPTHQPASLLWFHDHGMGTTRLNVFAGLAAAYLLRDANDTGAEPNPIGIPGGAYEIPLVIQDRQFNPDGTLRYPTSDIPGVTWIGEYFGDVFLVNGKVWPYLEVEPRLYRFRILNGCNARIMSLRFDGAPIWQIGAEGGMWDRPVQLKRLVLTPAERADVIVDFRGLAGTTIVLRNSTPADPVSTPAPDLGPVMQIRIGDRVTNPGPTSVPGSLPGRAANLPAPRRTRYITLNEIDVDTADWYLNLGGLHFMDKVTETPRAGTVEDWVYVNMTGDTHPMHTHLFTHQVVGRTPFDVEAYEQAYGTPNGVPGGIDPTPFATGPMQPPTPDERGFKDTAKANPGYFLTIRARIDLPAAARGPQTYVHHCHIVEHEDNDMMRPFTVTP
jgi:spore coat protein A